MHGSGAIGLEAISRGAKKAILCDNNKQAIQIIKKNIEKTQLQEKVELYQMNFEDMIKTKIKDKLDIIYLDPPYRTDYVYKAIKLLLKEEKLEIASIIIIETDQKEQVKKEIEDLEIEIIDERKYGRAHLIFLKKKV